MGTSSEDIEDVIKRSFLFGLHFGGAPITLTHIQLTAIVQKAIEEALAQGSRKASRLSPSP